MHLLVRRFGSLASIGLVPCASTETGLKIVDIEKFRRGVVMIGKNLGSYDHEPDKDGKWHGFGKIHTGVGENTYTGFFAHGCVYGMGKCTTENGIFFGFLGGLRSDIQPRYAGDIYKYYGNVVYPNGYKLIECVGANTYRILYVDGTELEYAEDDIIKIKVVYPDGRIAFYVPLGFWHHDQIGIDFKMIFRDGREFVSDNYTTSRDSRGYVNAQTFYLRYYGNSYISFKTTRYLFSYSCSGKCEAIETFSEKDVFVKKGETFEIWTNGKCETRVAEQDTPLGLHFFEEEKHWDRMRAVRACASQQHPVVQFDCQVCCMYDDHIDLAPKLRIAMWCDDEMVDWLCNVEL